MLSPISMYFRCFWLDCFMMTRFHHAAALSRPVPISTGISLVEEHTIKYRLCCWVTVEAVCTCRTKGNADRNLVASEYRSGAGRRRRYAASASPCCGWSRLGPSHQGSPVWHITKKHLFMKIRCRSTHKGRHIQTVKRLGYHWATEHSAAHYTGGSVNEISSVGQYKMHSFEIIASEKYYDLETLVNIHSRSLEMIPFDRSYMTSY